MVWVGRPGAIGGSIIGPSTVNTNDYITFLHSGPFTPGTYSWKVPGNGGMIPPNTNPCNCWKIQSGEHGARMYTYVGVYDGNVEVKKTNACGNGPAVYKYVDVQSGGGGGGGPIAARVAPNPTISSEMDISSLLKQQVNL